MSRRKLLATSEAGFVSLEASTHKRPIGTFVPTLGTPRRSPRLAAKRKRCHAESLPQLSLAKRSAPADSGLPAATLLAVRKIAHSRQCLHLSLIARLLGIGARLGTHAIVVTVRYFTSYKSVFHLEGGKPWDFPPPPPSDQFPPP